MKSGFSSTAMSRDVGASSRRMAFVVPPMPGPSSTTTECSLSRPSRTIRDSRKRELGRNEPSSAGLCRNSRRNVMGGASDMRRPFSGKGRARSSNLNASWPPGIGGSSPKSMKSDCVAKASGFDSVNLGLQFAVGVELRQLISRHWRGAAMAVFLRTDNHLDGGEKLARFVESVAEGAVEHVKNQVTRVDVY